MLVEVERIPFASAADAVKQCDVVICYFVTPHTIEVFVKFLKAPPPPEARKVLSEMGFWVDEIANCWICRKKVLWDDYIQPSSENEIDALMKIARAIVKQIRENEVDARYIVAEVLEKLPVEGKIGVTADDTLIVYEKHPLYNTAQSD